MKTDLTNSNILVIRFSALGDVAMTIPAIYSLAEQYPKVRVTVVTRPFFSRLFINAPANVTVIGVDLKNDYSGITGTFRLLHKLKSFRPDCVADLHNVLRSWIIDIWFRIHGVKVAMVNKRRSKRKKLFKTGEPQLNFVDRYANVFSRLGYPIELTFKSVFSAASKPSTPVEIKHPAIGIAPFARYTNKTYPPEMMLDTVQKITVEGYMVYLFGGRGNEADMLEKWADATENCTNLAGKYPLEQELSLISEMDLMVSMDSSNQHMAALTGTPVLSIWGSTIPACGFLGYGQTSGNALMLGLPCQPCTVAGKDTCYMGDFRCLRRITPEMIISKIKKLAPAKPEEKRL